MAGISIPRKRSKIQDEDRSSHGPWAAMIARCRYTSDGSYKDYGGKGIFVCLGLQDFNNFISMIGRRPSSRHSIDRINGNLSYTCGLCGECAAAGYELNVRWLTPVGQSNNRRDNRMFSFNGKTMTLSMWARELGVSRDFLHGRLWRGWSVERAFTEQCHANGSMLNILTETNHQPTTDLSSDRESASFCAQQPLTASPQ